MTLEARPTIDVRSWAAMLNDEANLNARQREQYIALESIANRYGKWSTGTDPDGAHYAPANANPFQAEGLICANCSFYEPDGECEIVAGPLAGEKVDPNAVCKLWIIPAANDAAQETALDLLRMLES